MSYVIPLAARSKAYVCGRSPAEIVGSNPTGGMDVCRKCCVLSDRSLCDELITCPEESYRLWYVVVCDIETSWMRRPWQALACSATARTKLSVCIISLVWDKNVIIYGVRKERDEMILAAFEVFCRDSSGDWKANLNFSQGTRCKVSISTLKTHVRRSVVRSLFNRQDTNIESEADM